MLENNSNIQQCKDGCKYYKRRGGKFDNDEQPIYICKRIEELTGCKVEINPDDYCSYFNKGE